MQNFPGGAEVIHKVLSRRIQACIHNIIQARDVTTDFARMWRAWHGAEVSPN